jgi:hypothetical protein
MFCLSHRVSYGFCFFSHCVGFVGFCFAGAISLVGYDSSRSSCRLCVVTCGCFYGCCLSWFSVCLRDCVVFQVFDKISSSMQVDESQGHCPMSGYAATIEDCGVEGVDSAPPSSQRLALPPAPVTFSPVEPLAPTAPVGSLSGLADGKAVSLTDSASAKEVTPSAPRRSGPLFRVFRDFRRFGLCDPFRLF